LALIEDACYKIYQPKVAKSAMQQAYQRMRRYAFTRSGRIFALAPISARAFSMPEPWSTGPCKF
jgi:hypothetical protein